VLIESVSTENIIIKKKASSRTVLKPRFSYQPPQYQ
jgi:hypothetical protein